MVWCIEIYCQTERSEKKSYRYEKSSFKNIISQHECKSASTGRIRQFGNELKYSPSMNSQSRKKFADNNQP